MMGGTADGAEFLTAGGARLTCMNPAAEQLLGWTQGELLGRKRAPGEGSIFCLRLPRAAQD